jgi:hypothetical protein
MAGRNFMGPMRPALHRLARMFEGGKPLVLSALGAQRPLTSRAQSPPPLPLPPAHQKVIIILYDLC